MENEIISLIEELDKVLKRSLESLGQHEEFIRLTLSQLNYLTVINRIETPTITVVADELHLSKPTVTLGVQKLLELGYLEKQQSPMDKRFYFLSLSKLGVKLISARDNALDDLVQEINRALTLKEQSQFEHLLKKINSRLKERYPAKIHDQ